MKCEKTKKVSYPTAGAAWKTVDRVKKRGIMNVYHCGSCGGWHLGRSNGQIRNADWIGTLLTRHERDLKARSVTGSGPS